MSRPTCSRCGVGSVHLNKQASSVEIVCSQCGVLFRGRKRSNWFGKLMGFGLRLGAFALLGAAVDGDFDLAGLDPNDFDWDQVI
jgi:ribosomal protein L37E